MLELDVWSDIACPWCYIGKRHLEQALADFEHAASVRLRWRAFELDPSAPRVRPATPSYAERLAAKYGASLPQAQQMIDRVVQTAGRVGLEMNYQQIQSGNTFDAHRLLHWAHATSPTTDLKERFLRAYFTEGRAIGDRDTLVELAADGGLDATAARAVVDSDRYVAEVRADQQLARELGISGVPFFVIAGKVAISGAQPPAVLLDALRQTHATTPATDAACGPDGCAV